LPGLNGFAHGAAGTPRNSPRNRRPWDMRSPTLPWASWRGYMRNSWFGPMNIRGMMMKVPFSPPFISSTDRLHNVVLTWISIFWFSRAGPAASLRIYFEAGDRQITTAFYSPEHPTIPLGLSHFPKDLLGVPKRFYTALSSSLPIRGLILFLQLVAWIREHRL
jgi:hypothetical protein